MMGARVARGKWMRGNLHAIQREKIKERRFTYGTKLVWNSFKSTFREPSKRKEAVIDETTWAISLFRLENVGEVTPRLFLQIS